VAPEFGCTLCLDLLYDPVMTPCNHCFCRSCISIVRTSGKSSCPLCREELTEFDPLAAPSSADLAAQIAAVVPQSVLDKRSSQAPHLLELVVSNLYEGTPELEPEHNSMKWTIWVTLSGMANEHTAKIVDKVVYKLPSTFEQRSVTAYPPFFSLCRLGAVDFTVRCQVQWNPLLSMRPTEVSHPVVFGKDPCVTKHRIYVDTVMFDILELARAPNSAVPLQRRRPRPFPIIADPTAFAALGLDAPQQEAWENPRTQLPLCVVPQNPLPPKDRYLLEVVVGNRNKMSSRTHDGHSCHEWTTYVIIPEFQASTSKMIEHVVYTLPADFIPNTFKRCVPNLEVTCVGWESFEITCSIHWNPVLGLQLTTLVHQLIDDELGGQTSVTVGVSSRRLHFCA